jgi:DNA mismatch endonuclease (patch repair protein)
VDTLSPRQRSERMGLIRGKDTTPELAVRRLVHGLGYRYRKHARGLPGKPDLVFSGRRKVIFVHGCFWHRHNCALGRMPKSRLRFWRAKLDGNRARDNRVKRRLRRNGWKVLVIWECQVRDGASVARRVRQFLNA